MSTQCSFCGKRQEQVRRLVANPDGSCYICENCIDICREIVKEEGNKDKGAKVSLPTPSELKRALDEFIIGQEEAKRIMSVAVYNHYKRLNYNLDNKHQESKVELDKSNVMLIGATGVGKTLIARTLATFLKVPFVCVDATTLTEAGYVGEDVESILSKLLQNADNDIKRAEMGIVYIDEIDKIARKDSARNMTRDVSGEGVQQALLKILEGTVAQLSPNNTRKMPHQEMVQINTNNILFICGGAFVKLPEIVQNRVLKKEVGFNKNTVQKNTQNKEKNTTKIQPIDLINFGMIPEFIGRLPVIVSLQDLDENALVNILTKPKNNLISQYKTIMKMEGKELQFTQEAVSLIAQKAIKLGLGARGLRTILEEVMLETMYQAPDKNEVLKIIIDKDCVAKCILPQMEFKQPNEVINTAVN